jgi:capsule polysaccharide export protein KpsC/LpsZ
MARLLAARKKIVAVGDFLARSPALRAIGRRTRLLSFMDGGMRFDGVAAAPWRAVVLGAPREEHGAIDRAFPEFKKLFVAKRVKTGRIYEELVRHPGTAILAWGVAAGPQLAKLQSRGIGSHPILYIDRAPVDIIDEAESLSGYVLDWTGLYCNSRRTSDLETILNGFPFIDHPELLAATTTLVRTRFPRSTLNGPVVVVCQHRSDPPALFAGATHPEARTLVEMAKDENPHSEIVLVQVCPLGGAQAKHREELEKLGSVASLGAVPDLLTRASRVYVASANLGFHALLSGIPVTTLGGAFYAGWGLTDDRRPVPRRQRPVSLSALAAGVMVLYSRFLRSGALVSAVSGVAAEPTK